MRLVDHIPHISKASLQSAEGPYLYKNEVELAIVLAALAEQCGIEARTQVPTPLGGFADLVLDLPDLGSVVIELKMTLTTPAQFRRAAEQVIGYSRHLGVLHAAILAPRVAEQPRSEFAEHYPDVTCFTVDSYCRFTERWSSPVGIATRLELVLAAAERLIGELPRSDRSVEALYGVRSARRVMMSEVAA